MPNILFKLGGLDLSTYVRVNPDEHFDPAQGDHLEPSFSDSPFFEGQYFTSLHAKNKEMNIPLFLHPSQAPYLQDGLNQIVQGVNNALRPVTDLGQLLNAEWRNAQASNSTFWTVQFGRFEPAFVFRQTEKGWLAGNLHLWTLPYGHTATERIIGTYAAPANQSGLQILPSALVAPGAGGTIVGDVSPQFDLRIRTGSYTGDDGQLGIISALPVPNYTPIIPVGSFYGLGASAIIYGASGAWASQFLAFDSVGGSQGAANQGSYNTQSFFSFALSPASVYAGDNRVLGLVRARAAPFGLRAFDSVGNPLGPTVIASAMDGWQVVDYGILSCPPWQATSTVNIQVYGGLPYTASGVFSSPRAAPAWTKEHGPIFVVPNAYTLVNLDFNSPVLSMDGFDGQASTSFGQDMLGNTWSGYAGFGAQRLALPPSVTAYSGSSGLKIGYASQLALAVGSSVAKTMEVEAVFTIPTTAIRSDGVGAYFPDLGFFMSRAAFTMAPASAYFTITAGANVGSVAVPSPLAGQYSVKFISGPSIITGLLWGPSGAFPGAASGAPLIATTTSFNPYGTGAVQCALYHGNMMQPNGADGTLVATTIIESFRARILASTGHQSLDTFHLSQPLNQNTRMLTASGPDVVDMQARQRGPLQAINLPVPSMGGGLFAASFPWDQGPANDLLSVDVRIRERFTYAR